MDATGVAIAGTGFGARVILPALAADPRVRVVALLGGADRDRTRALADGAGIPVWDAGFEAVCARSDVALVAIATPHELHGDMVRAALAAGKHIVCEKPLALDLAELEELVARGAASPGMHLIDLQLRYHPAVHAIGKALRGGRVGRPYEAQLVFRTDRYLFPKRPVRGWWFDPAKGGGVLMAVAPHLLDLVDDWFGLDVERLDCGVDRVLECVDDGRGGRLPVNAESAFSCVLTLRNGPRVWLSATAAAYTGTQLEMAISGSGGELRLHGDTAELHTAANGCAVRETLHEGTGGSLFVDGFRHFARALVDALRAGEPARVDGATTFERYAAQHCVLESMRRAAEEGGR